MTPSAASAEPTSGVQWRGGRPSAGARLTNRLLRAARAKQPLDMADPAALLRARDKLDRLDVAMSRPPFRVFRPFRWRDDECGGVPTREIEVRRPVAPRTDDVLIFIHGGGFFFRSINAHMLLAARIAGLAGISRVVHPLYRLAPEHAFPSALEDCVSVYRAVLEDGTPADRIVVAGDSAGGCLALGMLLSCRARNLPMPRAAALLSPMTDLSFSGASIETNRTSDPMFGGPPMAPPICYLGSRPGTDPGCSPLFADLAGLPPLIVQVGSTERLLDDSLRLRSAASAAGVEISVEVWNDMPHVFTAYDFAEARQARTRLAAFLRHPGTHG